MDELKIIVEKIRNLPEANVDCGIRQGHRAIIRQLGQLIHQVDEAFVEAEIERIQEIITQLVQSVKPYKLPEDYLFFLEFYGGLYIDSDHYYFSTYGLGPMSEEWYIPIISPDSLQESLEYGFLVVGSLNFYEGVKEGQSVKFFLDLKGTIEEHNVVGIGPFEKGMLTSHEIFREIRGHSGSWRKIAISFTHWLEEAAKTNGAFGYL